MSKIFADQPFQKQNICGRTSALHFTLFLVVSLIILLAACAAPAAQTEGAAQQDEQPAAADEAGAAEQSDLSLEPTVDVQTVASIMDRDDVFLLDVREQWEYDEGHIPNITLMPMETVGERLSELPTDKEIIVTCRSGNRSGTITDFLRQQGFTNVHNMEGGILAWQQAGLPVEQ